MSCTEFFSFLFVRVNKCVNIQYRVGTTVVLSNSKQTTVKICQKINFLTDKRLFSQKKF